MAAEPKTYQNHDLKTGFLNQPPTPDSIILPKTRNYQHIKHRRTKRKWEGGCVSTAKPSNK